ncbi:MAG: N-acetylmuramoyl-L-alanine amidase [Spirochaetota bacterium]|nr:N-acetylmuramoyl-L-alanine amidase [Spirochaetota bacterium]
MVDVIFHCSDSRFGNTALITMWHTLPPREVVQNGKRYKGNGWDNIGYHYVILNGWLNLNRYNSRYNGYIETGRPLDEDHLIESGERGAHVRGFNRNSVGICLIGKSGEFTDEQLNSALEITLSMEKQFIIINLLQHSDLDMSKPYCAGLDMDQFKINYEIYKEWQL